MHIYKSEHKSKEINVEDFPIQPVITHHKYLFCFHDKYASVRGVSIAVSEIFVHRDTHYTTDKFVPLQQQ
jgi:hypothetical protein